MEKLMNAFESETKTKKGDLAFAKFERIRVSKDGKQLLVFVGKHLCIPININYIKKILESKAAA